MFLEDPPIKMPLNRLISRGHKKDNIKPDQIQKSGQDTVLQGDDRLRRMDIQQFGVFLCQIELLDHPHDLLGKIQDRGYDRIFRAVLERAPDGLLIDEHLHFFQDEVLHLLPQISVWILGMLLDLGLLHSPVP